MRAYVCMYVCACVVFVVSIVNVAGVVFWTNVFVVIVVAAGVVIIVMIARCGFGDCSPLFWFCWLVGFSTCFSCLLTLLMLLRVCVVVVLHLKIRSFDVFEYGKSSCFTHTSLREQVDGSPPASVLSSPVSVL